MLKQRQQSNCQDSLYNSQKEVEKYFSVKADLSFKQNTKGITRGKIIRNQISKSNMEGNNKVDNNKTRTLTPQYVKAEHEKKRKKSQHQDIRSFKLEQSNVNSKYLTIKKDLRQNHSEKTNKGETTAQNPIGQVQQQPGNGTIILNQGWKYKGQYSAGLFHGYGELLHHNKIIYKGKFEFGYFHGHGKLQNCQTFNYLVSMINLSERLQELKAKGSIGNVCLDDSWSAYIGQFRRGEMHGFGQLWMKSYKIVGSWQRGKLKKKVVLVTNDSHY